MTRHRPALLAGVAAAAVVALPHMAAASNITMWNTDNVLVGPPVTGTDGAASVVYDRVLPDVAAESNGQIYYAAPEADTPGLRVENIPYTTGQGSFDGCILASSGTTCDGPFQSGKRFKQQFLKAGEMDLVFDVTPTPEASIYQVFHRIVNLTGKQIRDFTVELGFGIGDGFERSGAGDGLNFSQTVELGPNNEPAFSQYPFGLFGSLDQPNPNPLQLPGFFDTTARSGFDLDVSEDVLASDGYYGMYPALFGNWLSRDQAPAGLLWDYALGAADPLVMAWDNGVEWEVRRGIDDSLDGVIGDITAEDVFALDPADWATFAYGDIAGVEAFLSGVPLDEDFIEDLANLNLNYAIELGPDVGFEQFTLRVEVAAVPLPLSAPLLAAGLGALGLLRRRRG